SITLPGSPASFSSDNEVPHIFTWKSPVQPKEILIASAKRLLQQNRPRADIGRVEIPQRSRLLPYRVVLFFRSKAREVSGSEPAIVHHAARWRGGVAARGARAAGGNAGGRISRRRCARDERSCGGGNP